tara:strand:+ start:45 stop:908 length:864 start_codon:yes stop_codon:yes gene_type:complete
MKLAFIGLGVMGYPMAGHLAQAGHEVTVYNRTASKAEQWLSEHRGHVADSPAAAAINADCVMACVGRDDDVREITLGPHGAFENMARGSVFVDHTTTSAVLARELFEAAQAHGIDFIDAPVSGGQAGAENGQLTVMAGGEAEAFEKSNGAVSAYARAYRLLGSSGAGQLTKMVNQICVANVIQGLAEALNFGQAAGLDMAAVLEVISQGAAQSWQMENRGTSMCAGEYDFGFAVDWMRKDLGIVADEAARLEAPVPVTELIDRFYAEVQDMGGNRWDTSSLIERLRR